MNEQEYLDMTISLYDQEADTFAVMVRDYSPYIKYYDMFLPHLSGKKILDIGSGSGRDMLYFYNHGYDVTGVELSKGLISLYSKEITNRVICDDMRNIDVLFSQESFDGVRSFASLVHMSKDWGKAILGKIYDVLKDDGILLLSVKHWNNGYEEEIIKKSFTIPGSLKRYVYRGSDELKQVLLGLGFTFVYDYLYSPEGKDSWYSIVVRK